MVDLPPPEGEQRGYLSRLGEKDRFRITARRGPVANWTLANSTPSPGVEEASGGLVCRTAPWGWSITSKRMRTPT